MFITPLHKLHRRRIWPQGLRNIFPHGAAGTIHGLCQWLRLTPDSGNRIKILSALDNMIRMLQPVVVPQLTISPVFLDGAGLMTRAKDLPKTSLPES
jgi:hypothetical protein